MTVRELIRKLLDCPLDADAYVGKGTGPVQALWPTTTAFGPPGSGRVVIVIKP